MDADQTKDTAGVIAPPPLIALAALVLGLMLDRLWPIGVVGALVPRTPRLVLAVIFFLIAGYIVARAIYAFRKARTHVEPWKPATALVTTDIFTKTRNPMYEGIGLFMFGLVLGLASDWTLVCTIVAAFVLHHGVVLREEHYLERKFGAAYRRYRDEVPRYGWPF